MRLDHFIGRPFVAFHAGSNWAVELADGALIKNYDGRRKIKKADTKALEGSSLLAVESRNGTTVAKFGTSTQDGPVWAGEILFTPEKYSVVSPGGDEVWPEAPRPELDLPPDPSAERAVSGPEEFPNALAGGEGGEDAPES